MLRIKSECYGGWSTFRTCTQSVIFNKYIKKYMNELQSLRQMRGTSVQTVSGVDEILKFHFFCTLDATEEPHFQVNEQKMHAWSWNNSVVWRLSENNTSECEWFLQKTQYQEKQTIVELYEKTVHAKVESNFKIFEDFENAGSESEMFIGKIDLISVTVNLRENTSSFRFSPGIEASKIHPYMDAYCVNACYTGSIGANLMKTNHVSFFKHSKTKGPCGSEVTIKCNTLGIVQIFRPCLGLRRVTCKAFSKRSDVCMMMDMICQQFQVSGVENLVPHMIVSSGNTGAQMDVNPEGYVMSKITSAFKTVKFKSIIEEFNIHIIFNWDEMYSIYETIENTHYKAPHFQSSSKKIDLNIMRLEILLFNDVSILLMFAKLCMSVTCRGTCIYRIGIKKRQVMDESTTLMVIDKTERFEKLLNLILNFINTLLSN